MFLGMVSGNVLGMFLDMVQDMIQDMVLGKILIFHKFEEHDSVHMCSEVLGGTCVTKKRGGKGGSVSAVESRREKL